MEFLLLKEDHLRSAFRSPLDNFKLGAYPGQARRNAQARIVVVQEIFGVNHHIHAVLTISPARAMPQ